MGAEAPFAGGDINDLRSYLPERSGGRPAVELVLKAGLINLTARPLCDPRRRGGGHDLDGSGRRHRGCERIFLRVDRHLLDRRNVGAASWRSVFFLRSPSGVYALEVSERHHVPKIIGFGHLSLVVADQVEQRIVGAVADQTASAVKPAVGYVDASAEAAALSSPYHPLRTSRRGCRPKAKAATSNTRSGSVSWSVKGCGLIRVKLGVLIRSNGSDGRSDSKLLLFLLLLLADDVASNRMADEQEHDRDSREDREQRFAVGI